MSTFGERLKDAMAWSGVSVEALAKARKVSVLEVETWLLMKTADLTGEHAAWSGVILNVSIIWMTLGIGSPEPLGVPNNRKARLALKV